MAEANQRLFLISSGRRNSITSLREHRFLHADELLLHCKFNSDFARAAKAASPLGFNLILKSIKPNIKSRMVQNRAAALVELLLNNLETVCK